MPPILTQFQILILIHAAMPVGNLSGNCAASLHTHQGNTTAGTSQGHSLHIDRGDPLTFATYIACNWRAAAVVLTCRARPSHTFRVDTWDVHFSVTFEHMHRLGIRQSRGPGSL